MSAPLHLAAPAHPLTSPQKASGYVSKCPGCYAPLDEDHRTGCEAPLAVCPRCHTPMVTPSTRPKPEQLSRACVNPRCSVVVMLPTAFARDGR